jgi:hypothetical protein
MSTRAYNMTIANRVEKDRGWADDDIVVAATVVLYQRDIVILYCGTSLAVRTQARGIRRVETVRQCLALGCMFRGLHCCLGVWSTTQ